MLYQNYLEEFNCREAQFHGFAYLCIVYHVNSLEYDISCMLSQEGEDVCDTGLIGQASQSDTVPLRPTSDKLLWESDGGLG